MKNVDSEGRILLKVYERFINRKGEEERSAEEAKYNNFLDSKGVKLPLYYELNRSISNKIDKYMTEGRSEGEIQSLLLEDPEYGQFREEQRKRENLGYSDVSLKEAASRGKERVLPNALEMLSAPFNPDNIKGMLQLGGQAADLYNKMELGHRAITDPTWQNFGVTREQAMSQMPSGIGDYPALRAVAGSLKDYGTAEGRKKKLATAPIELLSDAAMVGSLATKPLTGALKLKGFNKSAKVTSAVGQGLDFLDLSSWGPKAVRGVGGWFFPKIKGKVSQKRLDAERRLAEKQILREGFVTSALTDNPKARDLEHYLFKKNHKPLLKKVQAVLDMPDIINEQLGNVSTAEASAKMMEGFSIFEDNFYRVQEELWEGLRQSIESKAKSLRETDLYTPKAERYTEGPKATSMGQAFEASRVLEPVPRMILSPKSKALAAIEGDFANTQRVYQELSNTESQLEPSRSMRFIKDLLKLKGGDSPLDGPLATSLEQLKQLRTQVFRELQLRPDRELGLHPTARSYLKRIYMGLTADINEAATRFSEEANHPLWGDIGQDFATDYKKISRSYAESKKVIDSQAGKAIIRAREKGHDLSDFVHYLAFRGDQGKDGGPLLTPEIDDFYQALDGVDPTIAADFRSATALKLIKDSKGQKGILRPDLLGKKIASMGHGGDRSHGEIRLRRLLGDDVAETILDLEEAFKGLDESGIPMDIVQSQGVADLGSNWLDKFQGWDSTSLVRLLFGGAPGITGGFMGAGIQSLASRGPSLATAKAALYGRSAVFVLMFGADVYKKTIDSRKRYVTGGQLAPLSEVLDFIEQADLPIRMMIKSGRRSYIGEEEDKSVAATGIKARQGRVNIDPKAQESLDQILKGPTELDIQKRPYR